MLPALVPAQPVADAVSVYTPASPNAADATPAVDAVGVVISPVIGPVHASVYPAPPTTLPVSVTALPTHAGAGDAVGDIDVGKELTVMVFDVEVLNKPLFVQVTLHL